MIAPRHRDDLAVSRRDHLCAALNNRLGLVDVCGLDANAKRVTSAIPQIVSGLPSDGYGRGVADPGAAQSADAVLSRAGWRTSARRWRRMVIDAKATAAQPNVKSWSSSQPDAAIADFVSTVMALTSSDPRSAPATALLQTHFTTAQQQGASASTRSSRRS